jgi:hypothetical protein
VVRFLIKPDPGSATFFHNLPEGLTEEKACIVDQDLYVIILLQFILKVADIFIIGLVSPDQGNIS